MGAFFHYNGKLGKKPPPSARFRHCFFTKPDRRAQGPADAAISLDVSPKFPYNQTILSDI